MGGNRDKRIDKDGTKSESKGENESERMIAGERGRERESEGESVMYVCRSRNIVPYPASSES